tara:strand:- start:3519 stop:4346 length:828 start_codon:yes stop_codon:yes gene_type:complete
MSTRFFFNSLTLDNINNISGTNYYDSGSGITQGTAIQNQQIRSLVNWALGDIYQTFDSSGSSLTTGNQYPEFLFEFKVAKAVTWVAFGNHNIATQSDGWTLSASADNVTFTEISNSTSTNFNSDADRVLFASSGSFKYWKIRFNNVQTNFKIGLFSFCDVVYPTEVSASFTYIVGDMLEGKTKAGYGKNYHLSKFDQSFDNFTINLKNLTKSYIDNNAPRILEGVKSPFIFYYRYSTSGENLAAFCLPIGQQKGVAINNNHLYSLPITTKARSWS